MPLPSTTRRAWRDIALGAVLYALGGTIAVFFLRDVGKTFFYQTQMAAAVMAACGHGLTEPVSQPQSLTDFLFMRTLSFDCAQLSSITQTRPIGSMTEIHLYLIGAVVFLWRWLGVSYGSLAVLLAGLHGAYGAGCYTLCRLFDLRRVLAFLVGLIVLISPVTVSMLFFLRDYSKAPFIIWTLVLLVLAMRERQAGRLIFLGFALGATIGIGNGFRSDLALVMFPLSFLILVFGLAPTNKLLIRVGAVCVFLVTAILIMAPLRPTAPAGGSGFLIMEGETTPFLAYLGLEPAPYDLGWRYADELAFASISSDLRRDDPAKYDAGESAPFRGVTQSLRNSTRYVANWLPLFSADVVTRELKSAILLTGYYDAFAPERRALDPFPAPFASLRAGAVLTDTSVQIFGLLTHSWIATAVGLAGLCALVFRVYARSPREAACVALLFTALVTYPSFQFSSRHFFHLEILVWLGAGSLLALPFEWRRLRDHWTGFALWTGAIVLIMLVGLAALGAFQDRALKGRVAQLLAGPRSPIQTSRVPSPSNRTLITLPVPSDAVALIDGPPDSLSLPQIETVPPYEVRSASQRLLVEIGGPACPPGPVDIKLSYLTRPGIWQPFERTVVIRPPTDPTKRTLFTTSAFYRPTQHFQGFEVDDGHLACLGRIFRLDGITPLPAIFSASLSPGWADRPFHLGLGSF